MDQSEPHTTYWRYEVHGMLMTFRLTKNEYGSYEHYHTRPGWQEITHAEYRAIREERRASRSHSVQAYVNYETLKKLQANAKKAGKKPGEYAAEILEWYIRKV